VRELEAHSCKAVQCHLKRSKEFLEPSPPGASPRNSVDDNVERRSAKLRFRPEMEVEYGHARWLEEARVAEDLRERDTEVGTRVLESEQSEVIQRRIDESSTNFKFRCTERDYRR
jgi:hypothetical protein